VDARRRPARPKPTLWYKDAVVYEVHVRAFHDSNGDGIGDLRGLVPKLEYLQELGVTALWLLPFYPSPLKDDGYDIADYKSIHQSYGTLRDFRLLLREARRQNLRVITELVLNHTSDQHPWFQRARRAPAGTPQRDFYVWSETPDRYQDARIIFKDFEASNWTWDPVAQAYYWHRFYAHQPDLNFENPEVRRAMLNVVDFWFDLGVDGLRLDAVPYLFEREGTNCENLPETYAFLSELRAHVDERFDDKMLLAEANQWPEDAAAYFGPKGDRCHMAFHFPLMPRMFMSIRMEDRFPVVDIMNQTPAIPETAQWAVFLRNHDELTLEMVTDEERDYMYRVYAEDPQARINLGIRRRLAPLLGNDRRLIEMMNGLLFSLPGTPVIYYGDEIGMGDNIYLGDRNGVRTPMQWSSDRNAGFSRANPQRLYLPAIIDPEYHFEALNVEAQQNNPHSLLWFMKRLIALRKRYRAFGRGSIEFLYPENRKVLTFFRTFQDERILVVANLSRQAQYVELDLSEYRGMVPLELFGHTEFPRIGDLPYLLTLGPHAFFWFALEPQPAEEEVEPSPAFRLPMLSVRESWEELVFADRAREALQEILPSYLRERRWFGAKGRRITSVELTEAIPVPGPQVEGRPPSTVAVVTFVQVGFAEGDPETYVLPLACTEPYKILPSGRNLPPGAVARVRGPGGDRVLFDAVWEMAFARGLLQAVERRRRLNGSEGRLLAQPTGAFREVRGPADIALEPTVLSAEQSNTSIAFGERLLLKLYRRLDQGVNPDLEVGRVLTEEVRFEHTPPVAGWLEYRRTQPRGRPATVAILHGFVQNEGDAWRYTLDALHGFLTEAMTRRPEDEEPPIPSRPSLFALASQPAPALARPMLRSYLESARLLGQRTAELHLALSSRPEHPDFAPEPFTPHYQRALYQSIRGEIARTYRFLRGRERQIPQLVQILDLEPSLQSRAHSILDVRIEAKRIRTHGDFHLGQVLYTGRDFVIIDFEGEPARPLSERTIKRTAFRDVAGMIRSFHYAAYASLFADRGGVLGPENPAYLEPWVLFWYLWVSASFLRSYLDVVSAGDILPTDEKELTVLLDVLLIEKVMYELRYEIDNRPDWVRVPIKGILDLMESG